VKKIRIRNFYRIPRDPNGANGWLVKVKLPVKKEEQEKREISGKGVGERLADDNDGQTGAGGALNGVTKEDDNLDKYR
jgi:hypothetical protein